MSRDPQLDGLVKPKIRVLRFLRQLIDSGELPTGEAVPSEKILASKLGITRSAVRAAFQQLEADGVVAARGRGRIVTGHAVEAPAPPRHPIVAVVNGSIGPIPSYQRSIGWNIYGQATLDRHLRAHGVIPRPIAPGDLEGEFARPPGERPSGLILLCDGGADLRMLQLMETHRHVPQVVYASAADLPEVENRDAVVADHAAGGAALVRWLAAQGRRHLLRVWHLDEPTGDLPPWLQQRDKGMCDAARALGLELPPPLRVQKSPMQPPTELLRKSFALWCLAMAGAFAPLKLESNRIDALLMINDSMLLLAAAGLRHLGIQRDDLLLAGYDALWADLPEQVWAPTIPAVTIERGNLAVGTALAELMLARLADQAPLAPVLRMIAPTLIVPTKTDKPYHVGK